MKFYRGDTFVVTASYDGYTIGPGDVITAGIFQKNGDDEEYTLLKEVSITATDSADEVQLEFSREDMKDIEGDLMVEVRTVTASDTEMTIQKEINLGKDGLRWVQEY